MLDKLPSEIICQIVEFCADKHRVSLRNIARTFNEIIQPQIAFQTWTTSNFYYFTHESAFHKRITNELCSTILTNTEKVIIEDNDYDSDMDWISNIYKTIPRKNRKIQELQLTRRTDICSKNILSFIKLSSSLNKISIENIHLNSNDPFLFNDLRKLKRVFKKRKSKEQNVKVSVTNLCINCKSEYEAFEIAKFGAHLVKHLTLDIFSSINNRSLKYSDQMPNWWKTCESLETYNWALLFTNDFRLNTSFKTIHLKCRGFDELDENGNVIRDTCDFFYLDIFPTLLKNQNPADFVQLQHLQIDCLLFDHTVSEAKIIYENALKLILLRCPNLQLLKFEYLSSKQIPRPIIQKIKEIIQTCCVSFHGINLNANYYSSSSSSFIEFCSEKYDQENDRANEYSKNGFEILFSMHLFIQESNNV